MLPDTDPDAIAEYLGQAALVIERTSLEAGPLSQWIHAGLVAHGVPAVCIETRRTNAAIGAMPFKTDRGDARGIAPLMRIAGAKTPLPKPLPKQFGSEFLITYKGLVLRMKSPLEV